MERTDRRYDEKLRELRERLLLMAARVQQMVSRSMEALLNRDVDLAKKTIEADHQVNRDEMEADGLCLLILARWQPVASDLRFITLALKMVTDLERIGDLAVNVSERALLLSNAAPIARFVDISKMAKIVESMIADAVDAFVYGDAAKAKQVINRDDEVDELHTKIFRDRLASMTCDEVSIERGIHVLSVAKQLERMADHCTNLAEQVVFMVEGSDIRHVGKLVEDQDRQMS